MTLTRHLFAMPHSPAPQANPPAKPAAHLPALLRRGLARLGTLLVLLMLAQGAVMPAMAQVPMPSSAPPPPAVTPEAVKSALQELLAATPGNDAISTADPVIDPGALDLILKPLTTAQLKVEMGAWRDVLQAAVADLSTAELELFQLNAAEEAKAASAAEANAATDAAPSGDQAQTTADQTADGAVPELTPEQEALVKKTGELREHRTQISDRFRVVMDAYEAKGGAADDTKPYRAYVADVGGVEVDTTDMHSAWLTLKDWAAAEDGGQRLLRRIGTVMIATLVGLGAGWLISLAVNVALRSTGLTSKLMRHFLRNWIARVGGLIGFLVGLSWIGTNMTPILAGLGAAGFILAFALQNTISNFASGMLILFLRPFDAGDEIEAAGVSGEVEKVSLFSTHLSTSENRKVIVPNNKIWEDVIVNSTGADTRRLALDVEVNAAEHSIEEAETILREVMVAHPDVLKDPEPGLDLTAVSADSFTFSCRPWVRTEQRDRLKWDLVSQFGRKLSVVKG